MPTINHSTLLSTHSTEANTTNLQKPNGSQLSKQVDDSS